MTELVKGFEVTFKRLGAGGVPSDGELALINRYALEPLTAEQLYVRRMRLCNDQVDREFERFPRGYLERFAETLPGKSLLANHNLDQFALGRFFKAELEEEAGVTFLVPSFYMVRLPENEAARRQMDGGVWSHVSIGARVDRLFCDLCGKEYGDWMSEEGCRHVRGRVYEGRLCTLTYGGDLSRVEALEGSLVWLGCQYGTEMAKSAGGVWPWRRRWDKEAMMGQGSERVSVGEERVLSAVRQEREAEAGSVVETVEERLAAVEAELAACRGELEVVRAARKAAEEGLAARGEELVSLKQQREAEAGLAADGRLYREDLRAEMKRLAGLIGAEKECEAILAAGQDAFEARRLKELVGEYAARAEKLFPPSGKGLPCPPAVTTSAGLRTPRLHAVI